jgi:hypothetical protein
MTEVQIETVTNPDDAELKLSLKYWVLGIGLTITLVAACLVTFYVPKAEVRDIVAVITGGIVSTTLIYHVMNYHMNYEVNRIKFRYDDRKIVSDRKVQAIAMIGEWHKPDMMTRTVKAYSFLKSYRDKSPEAFNDALELDAEARIAIITILNFFERVALAIDAKVVDEAIIKSFFKGLVREYYHGTINGLINPRRRERNNNRIFTELEELNKRWER